MIEELVKKYEERGIKFWVENGQLKFKAPVGSLDESDKKRLREVKEQLVRYYNKKDKSACIADLSNRYEEFPLTGIQSAYLLGRDRNFEYGGVGCHAYFELSMPHMDGEKLQQAWHKVIMRHDMLRAIFLKNGTQRILKNVDLPSIKCLDLEDAGEEEVKHQIEKIRSELEQKQYKADVWPLFDFRLTNTAEGSIVHFSIDMLLSDFISMKIIFNDLDGFYYENGDNLRPLKISFRDVLIHQKALLESGNNVKREQDRKYWKERIEGFPDAPELTTLQTDENEKVTFSQHRFFIDTEQWNNMCKIARKQKITPSGIVLAAYAETLGRWSKKKDFCMDITILNRPAVHEQVNDIVGDFTEINLLSIKLDQTKSFAERAKMIQNQLWEDISHNAFSGIDVLREINRNNDKKVIVPVVYTSTVGVANKCQNTNWEFMRDAQIVYKISQTPQVWIDCQVSEENDGILINWDVRDGVFPEGMIEDAFQAFSILLMNLSQSSENWEKTSPLELPKRMKDVRKTVNETTEEIEEKMLHEGFYENLQRNPDAVALISKEGSFSYFELSEYVAKIQEKLKRLGMEAGDFVAISEEKGMWQIASVLAVLFSGGVYLPFDVSQPLARQNKILERSGTKILLTNATYVDLEWKEDVAVIGVEDIEEYPEAKLFKIEVSLEKPAYIIHTSGTTGDPKGVVISHKAASNTIYDINRKFSITNQDRMFGLANLAFDLSVYDIFGAFNAGAALVLPDPIKQKDPYHWVETVKLHDVTIWNSVPAQMQMFVSVLEANTQNAVSPLRVVLLSGDWIPVTLPEQIQKSCVNAKVISLGGATEAAIWSIFHEIANVDKSAVSIPYGKPLANQRFYVLNENLEECPDWVSGELYIGGKGLALEYLNKKDETEDHFIFHPILKQRIYKTGDIGRYWPNGVIEFLGREDTQVKIHGHRIELSEIESALLNCNLVKRAVVIIIGERPQEYRIVAFVEGQIDEGELTEYMKSQVPGYMIPSLFILDEKIPLSSNGKVNRKVLKKLAEKHSVYEIKEEMLPETDLEKAVANQWKELLHVEHINRIDNFYDLGGDSLLVAQVISKIKENVPQAYSLEWDQLMIGMLQNPTIEKFCEFLECQQSKKYEISEEKNKPLKIIKEPANSEETIQVFFPGGIGSIQQFNLLFKQLMEEGQTKEGIVAFDYTEDQEYLNPSEKEHIVETGRRYASMLLKHGYTSFKLVGYCMGGLIAIETGRALLEAGVTIEPVVTIDSIPIVLEMEGDLLMERSFGLMIGAEVEKAGHIAEDSKIKAALELLKNRRNGYISEEDIFALEGELSSVAECYRGRKEIEQSTRLKMLLDVIPDANLQFDEIDLEHLKKLFALYKRNYRCAINYTPRAFAGELCALSCLEPDSPFVPVMKPGTEEFLEKCAMNLMKVVPIRGNHVTCMQPSYISDIVECLMEGVQK